jgi:hypothetical protein
MTSVLREGGSETSFCGWGCGVIEARIRNDGRADNGGMERSLMRFLMRVAEESADESKELNEGEMEAIADERETGRDGGSMDMVRDSVLSRMMGLGTGSYACIVGTGMETETEAAVVG